MDAIAELNITVDAENMEKDIFIILANTRSSWKPAEIGVEVSITKKKHNYTTNVKLRRW